MSSVARWTYWPTSRPVGQHPGQLANIPASDVKQIRILGGPTTAFLQGSANGAIHVETKSGPDGRRIDPQQ